MHKTNDVNSCTLSHISISNLGAALPLHSSEQDGALPAVILSDRQQPSHHNYLVVPSRHGAAQGTFPRDTSSAGKGFKAQPQQWLWSIQT